MAWEFSFHFAGSLESPLAPSSEAYHPSSTYFHQECQWFFDPPPARQLILKISTAHKMSKSFKTFSISTLYAHAVECTKASFLSEEDWISKITKVLLWAREAALPLPPWRWRKAFDVPITILHSMQTLQKKKRLFTFAFQRKFHIFDPLHKWFGFSSKTISKIVDRLSDSRLRG